MLETSARILRLLSLLQMPREWSGTDLAARLDVTTRTVRNDVERLRRLGYPVHATRGAIGGYRLGAGSTLPPLLLDDEEAVAVAVGMRTATGGSVTGIEESALRVLAKLEQVLPPRLRRRLNTLQTYTATVPPQRSTEQVAPELLTTITAAARDHERLRFDYVTRAAASALRDVEPYQLVNWGRRWYLVAWDTMRDDWRIFRVDRMGEPRTPTGPRFTPRPLPDDDLAAYVSRSVASASWRYTARVTVHAPAETVAERLPPWVGPVEAVDEHTCVVSSGSDNVEMLAVWLGMLGADFTIDPTASPELATQLRALATRYERAAAG